MFPQLLSWETISRSLLTSLKLESASQCHVNEIKLMKNWFLSSSSTLNKHCTLGFFKKVLTLGSYDTQ